MKIIRLMQKRLSPCDWQEENFSIEECNINRMQNLKEDLPSDPIEQIINNDEEYNNFTF